MLNNEIIDFDKLITKKVIIKYVIDGKEFDTKKNAKEYYIKKYNAKEINKSRFVSYIIKYDFTLEKEIGKPQLDSEIWEYETDIGWWLRICERYIDNKNKKYGHETQDGRNIGYIIKYYKSVEGKLEEILL